jgi:hypothetical protein
VKAFSLICLLFVLFGLTAQSSSAETRQFYDSLSGSDQKFYQFYKKRLLINGKKGRFSPKASNTLVNGKLYMEYKKYPKLTSSCSGTVIPRPASYRYKKRNPVLIATAAHCVTQVYRGKILYPDNIYFLPGYKVLKKSFFGMYRIKGFKYSGYYDPLISESDPDKDNSFDFAFLELDDRSSKFIYQDVGYSGIFFNAPKSRFYRSFGYPDDIFSTGLVDMISNGEKLRSCFGSIYQGPAEIQGNDLFSKPIITNCNLGHGSSGGAKTIKYHRQQYLIGVNSFLFEGNKIFQNLSGAAVFSSVARALWQGGWSYKAAFANPIRVGNTRE